MNSIARLIVWVAALVAAADCQPVLFAVATDNQQAAARAAGPNPPPGQHPAACACPQDEALCGMNDVRRSRASRGRRGDALDDLVESLLSCICWLGKLVASALTSWLSAVAFGCLGLYLAGPLAGQQRSFVEGVPPLVDERFALRDDALVADMVPPRDNAIFAPPPPTNDVRYLPDGNGWIVVSDPSEYPRIPAFDCDDPCSVFYTWRANWFGVEVPDEWDFYNLINTDRPDFTDATYSVGRGVTIIETGYTYRRAIDHEANSEQSRRSIPEALVRYGLTDEFEIRLKWNGYVMSSLRDFNTGLHEQLFGTDDLITSIKYEVWQQNGLLPMLTFLTGSTLPSGTNGISSNQMQPFVNFVAGWGLRRWLYLKASTGIDWQKTSISTLFGGGSTPAGPIVVFLRDNINVYHFSSSLLYQALPRVGGFAEFFGFAQTGGRDNRSAIYFDTGLYLYATTNVQFDVRYGVRLSNRVDELFTGAGFSVRF
jgi:Putative MetA-pathway of phenol degradation